MVVCVCDWFRCVAVGFIVVNSVDYIGSLLFACGWFGFMFAFCFVCLLFSCVGALLVLVDL